jgi:phosphatidylinositol kinase/protein kinase (PI-3  family)
MLQRSSGKVVHIDFGDLFEVTMTRKELPEKVPFRLTRLLIKAMEACGIDGNYRFTCINVMEVIRGNKESLLAILESFITDPLLNWRLIAPELVAAADIQLNNQKINKHMSFADVEGELIIDVQNEEYIRELWWKS